MPGLFDNYSLSLEKYFNRCSLCNPQRLKMNCLDFFAAMRQVSPVRLQRLAKQNSWHQMHFLLAQVEGSQASGKAEFMASNLLSSCTSRRQSTHTVQYS